MTMAGIAWETPVVPGGHAVVEGDARLVLPLLDGVFDLAYLDPPYSTGSRQLSYNDSLGVPQWNALFRAVAESAIGRLNPGNPCPILVSVDDNRLVQARTVLDELLPGGYAATVVVENSARPGARFVSVGHEYLVIYTTCPSVLRRKHVKWRVSKPGTRRVLGQAARIWGECQPDQQAASLGMRAWYRRNQACAEIWRCREYKWFTEDGRLFRRGPLSAPRGSRHYYYSIVSPTGEVFVPGEWGWRMPQSTWQGWLDSGQVDWGQQGGMIPARCLFLDEHDMTVPGSVERVWSASTTRSLPQAVRDSGFSYPKNPVLLAKWFDVVSLGSRRVRILEPFAGTAPAIQAAQLLNQGDGGQRVATSVQICEQARNRGGMIFDTVTLPCARQAAGGSLNVGRYS